MFDRPKLTPGKDAAIAILVTDHTNPLAVTDAAGLTVTVYLSATKGGPPIDPSLVFNTTEEVAPAGYSGKLYLAAVPGAATKDLLLPFVDGSVFVCPTGDGEPLTPIEIDVGW